MWLPFPVTMDIMMTFISTSPRDKGLSLLFRKFFLRYLFGGRDKLTSIFALI
jgi:hypothetical protein